MDIRDVALAAVCGNEVRIFGVVPHGSQVRPLLKVMTFPHYGAAVLFAQEYEERQLGEGPRKG